VAEKLSSDLEDDLSEIEAEHDCKIIAEREGGDLKRGKPLYDAVARELKDAGLL